MSEEFSDAELESFLEETLGGQRAVEIERALTNDQTLLTRLTEINGRRNSGIHTLGEIWRRNQIGVPTTEAMGSYLLGVLEDEHANYVDFRLDVLKCPFTIALKTDLLNQHKESAEESNNRRSKIYDSSSGYLPNTRKQ